MRSIVLLSTVQNPEEPLTCTTQGIARVPENTVINDFDLIALEAAVQCKEKGWIDEVVVFSLAGDRSHLQKALAMGADRAVWGCIENENLTPDTVARTAFETFGTSDDIWFAGKLGVNFESHSTAQILAQMLGCPCLCSAYEIQCAGDAWRILCEDDAGIPEYEVHPPFVVTADLRLNTPRFPSLPNIIRAKKKPVQEIVVSPVATATQGMQNASGRRRNCRFAKDAAEMVEWIRSV